MNWFLLVVFGILPFTGALFAFRAWHLLRYAERVTGTPAMSGCVVRITVRDAREVEHTRLESAA